MTEVYLHPPGVMDHQRAVHVFLVAGSAGDPL